MSFRDTIQTVMRNTRLNTAYFAETVTYRPGDGSELSLDVHVRHTLRLDTRGDGTTVIFDQLRVEIDRDDLTGPPDFGDRILLADDQYGYLYAYAGRHTPVSYKAVFERSRYAAQGTGKPQPSGRAAA